LKTIANFRHVFIESNHWGGNLISEAVVPPTDAACYWAAALFLAPLFLQRVFVGAEGDSYADYPGFSLSIIGYCSHVVFASIALLRFKDIRIKSYRGLLFFAGFGLLSIFHIFFTSRISNFSPMELTLPLGRGWLWVLATTIYFSIYYDKHIFTEVFLKMCRVAAWISIASFTSYVLFKYPFGTHIASGYPRVHGFFSEPSALAGVFPAFGVLSMLRRRWVDVALAFAGILLSASVIAYTTSILICTCYLLSRAGHVRTLAAVMFGYVGLIVSTPLLINADNSFAISESSNEILAWLDGAFNTDGLFFQVFLGRVFGSLSLLSAIVSNYSIDNLGSGLARLIGPIVTVDELRASGLQNIGFGLNVFGYMSVQAYDDIFDFGLFPFLLSSFGIPLSILAVFALTRSIKNEVWDPSGVGIIFLGSFFPMLVNSAGGIHSYSILLIPLFVAIFHSNPIPRAR
jgi:ABC-type amino acid transport system permease subunit